MAEWLNCPRIKSNANAALQRDGWMPASSLLAPFTGRLVPFQSFAGAVLAAVHAVTLAAPADQALPPRSAPAASISLNSDADAGAGAATPESGANTPSEAKQSALGDPELPAWRSRCPGAARWLDAHPEETETGMQQRDASRTLTHPELLAQLQSRVDADQTARRAWLADRNSASAAADVRNIDADNLRWMIRTFAKNGLPTAAQVGEYGLHLTWLLVHHADSNPRFQEISLKEFTKRHAAGEFSANDLARLSDRVAVKFGQPQPYGTLQNWVKGGVDKQTIPNLVDIEARRAQLGIMSLADYGCMMHAIRGPAVE